VTARQQILVSGVGGQGVLFIARLLADAAIGKGAGVLTSETHGMAQRGGVVVSHLKVGDFSSPLVRPSHADGLFVLSAENFALHRRYLRPSGWAFVNAPPGAGLEGGGANVRAVDADGLARKSGSPMAANLVLLGCALSGRAGNEGTGLLFCSPGEVEAALKRRLEGKGRLLGASLQALALGMREGTR